VAVVVKAENQNSTIKEDCFSAFAVSLSFKLNFFKTQSNDWVFFFEVNPNTTSGSGGKSLKSEFYYKGRLFFGFCRFLIF
jgi:hypothetical protein